MSQYTIAEMAKILEVSKNTVYNKLNSLQNELKPFTEVRKGVKYISEEGLELIKNSIYIQSEAEQETAATAEALNPFNTLQDNFINALKAEIEHLKTQLQVKDNQIQEQTELVKREQQLRMNEQQMSKQSLMLLEEHTKEIDEKLTNWRIEREQEKTEDKKPGIWRKIFGS